MASCESSSRPGCRSWASASTATAAGLLLAFAAERARDVPDRAPPALRRSLAAGWGRQAMTIERASRCGT